MSVLSGRAFTGALAVVTSAWATQNATQRDASVQNLHRLLPSPPPPQCANLAILTTHTISELLSIDEPTHPEASPWTKHPSYSEPLLEHLLSLLTRVVTPDCPVHYLHTAYAGAPHPVSLSTAHLLHTLSDMFTYDHPIRVHALKAISVFIRALDPPLVAAFMPGLVSSLFNILSVSTRHASPVVISAFDAFEALLVAFPPVSTDRPSPTDHTWSFSAALDALKETTTSAPQPVEEILDVPNPAESVRVKRDSAWLSAVSERLSLRLRLLAVAREGPLLHSNSRVRKRFCSFIHAILKLQGVIKLSDDARVSLRDSLLILTGDDFPDVAKAAFSVVVYAYSSGTISLRDIETGLRALVHFVERLYGVREPSAQDADSSRLQKIANRNDAALRAMTEASDSAWVSLARGYLVCLASEKEDQLISSIRMTASLARVGSESFVVLLVALHSKVWQLSDHAEASIAQSLDNCVLRSAFCMGKSGLLSSVFAALHERATPTPEDEFSDYDIGSADHLSLYSFKDRAHAALILQAAVKGAIARTDLPDDETSSHDAFVYQCTTEVLDSMNYFLLPTVDNMVAEQSHRVDDIMINLKHCLLLCTSDLFQEIASFRKRIKAKPLGAAMVLVVLMSILRDVCHGETLARQTALKTLRSIARTVRCSSERKLLLRHLNFIVARISRNLEKRWAGDILAFVIGKDGDEVSGEAITLLEATLRGMCNGLAGAGDPRALKTLSSIENVLSTAVSQVSDKDRTDKTIRIVEKARESKPRGLSDGDKADLRKKLFYYCTDDIEDYGALTHAPDPFPESSEFDDDTDDSQKNPFEEVAVSTLDGMRDLLVGRPWDVRASALRCAALAVTLLKGRRKVILPHAAKTLPLLPDQFVILNQELSAGDRMLSSFKRKKAGTREDGEHVEDLIAFLNSKAAELPVITQSCLLLSALADCAGSFIRDRFVRLIYPKMRPLLRLASCFPTLLVPKATDSLVTPPSHGAMSACDACIEAIASVASVLPDVLAPFALSLVKYLLIFFDQRYDPEKSSKRKVVHVNRAMVRYEIERWQKRRAAAETIIRQLKKISTGDVLVGLLYYDHTAPAEVRPLHSDLHSIRVKANPPF